jgi:hypothetical protein
MVISPALSLPPGRPARTPAEREYAQALVRHSAARTQLGQAVEREREAWKVLLKRVGDHGPVHSNVEAARRTWEALLSAKARAASEVESASKAYNVALQAWTAEAAGAFSRKGALHG